ncbi:MAG: hypothetical protein ACREQD_08650, partial [Candidatus Binataceae bacterium]
MADNLSGIGDAIRQAGEAYAQTIATFTKALQGLGAQASGPERQPLVENWLRLARMSKDGVITALEQGFEMWEREIRRTTAASGGAPTSANPMEAWSENWRKAVESFGGGAGNEEFRKQAEA